MADVILRILTVTTHSSVYRKDVIVSTGLLKQIDFVGSGFRVIGEVLTFQNCQRNTIVSFSDTRNPKISHDANRMRVDSYPTQKETRFFVPTNNNKSLSYREAKQQIRSPHEIK